MELERTPHFGSTPFPLTANTTLIATSLLSLLLFLLSEWQVEDLHILVSRAEQRDKGRIFFHDAYTDDKRRVYKCMTICMTSCGLWCMKAVHIILSHTLQSSSVANPGCWCRISDMNFSFPDPGSKRSRIRIRIKEFKYFYPKNCFCAEQPHQYFNTSQCSLIL